MRWIAPAIFLMSVKLVAQWNMPIGIVRGEIVSWNGSPKSGEIEVRDAENRVSSCAFDLYTYFERERQPTSVTSFRAGDRVEVVVDRAPDTGLCYARTVESHLKGEHFKLESPTERFAPRGDLTFGGTVVRRTVETLIVRTHAGDVPVLLRPDTRYLGQGIRLDWAALEVNMHVFIRAGRDVNGDIEAFQVIWGGIVSPE